MRDTVGRAMPSGVVTFLFTDIEGSTRRWEADPEVMRAALAAHDDVLRTAIEAQGGRIFKHTGDGVCAVFTSPKAAVEAAVAAQRALELPVRMGIATGEAELRGSDYFGAVLNRAARVMAAGHGGQILLDGQTTGLLRGVELVDLGARRLRDITDPVQVFQVRAPALRTEFPPLATQDPASGNLRVPTSSFIGRESEIAEIVTELRAHRLVTLSGVGGVGKTRLALEVASHLAEEFPDGVWVFELASVTDAAAVPDAVAAVLGITQQPGKNVADSVAAALEGRVRLLVFDNCEHVLDAATDLIEAILVQSATVRILATSREGFGAADEQVWPVATLDLEAGTDSAAVRLFADRAHSVAPQFSMEKPEEGVAVMTICRRLDGLPLAIELAASRMASMSASEVRDRLDDRFRLLIGSRRSLSRHQTLRHAVAWSYDLLSEDEQILLDRCSVFTGGFDLESACAVSESGDEYAVLDRLDALVRKSLLVANRPSGHTRYSMLETIRQFAEDQLVARGEATEARTRHAHYFADKETDVLALWDSPRQREAYDWFSIELPNLRTAFRWAADHNDIDSAAAIAVYATMIGFWVEQYEPVAWAEELIEPAKAVAHRRVAQLYVMAARCYVAGRLDDASEYAEAGRLAIDSGRFDAIPYEVDTELGGANIVKGNPGPWIEFCRKRIAGSPGPHIYTRGFLVSTLTMVGADDEAVAASESLSTVESVTDNPALICWALLMYGYARHNADPAAAYEVHRRCVMIAQESGNRLLETYAYGNLCRIAATHGDFADAFDFIAQAIRNYFDSGNFSLMSQPMAVLTTYLDRLGYHEPAATISGFATTPFTQNFFPELDTAITHLREVLGDETYRSLASTGAKMTNAAMATYAYDQIDQARAQLQQGNEKS